ncbi:hypothetical protein OAT00_01260 [Pelagibacteraceae bacterium]|nr:hypothetical protein [Pelagibacteraceae bacterium]
MSLINNNNRKMNDMITMNKLNEQFNEVFEVDTNLFVSNKDFKNFCEREDYSIYENLDNQYFKEVSKLYSDTYSVSV